MILAYEDHTWDTEIHHIPIIDGGDLNHWWWTEGPGAGGKYRKVVFVGIYNGNPEE